MAAWWQSLSALDHVLLYIAVPATLILLIQTVLLFAGGAFDSDGDAGVPDADGPDFDGPDADGGPLHEAAADPETPDTGLHLFTVRGVVAFLVLFGWGGLWLHQVGLPGFLAVFLAIPIGFAGMVGIALAVRQALRLQYDGTLDLRNALGRTGTVYLTVPPGRSSPGKVTLTVQEQLTEFEALTDRDIARVRLPAEGSVELYGPLAALACAVGLGRPLWEAVSRLGQSRPSV